MAANHQAFRRSLFGTAPQLTDLPTSANGDSRKPLTSSSTGTPAWSIRRHSVVGPELVAFQFWPFPAQQTEHQKHEDHMMRSACRQYGPTPSQKPRRAGRQAGTCSSLPPASPCFGVSTPPRPLHLDAGDGAIVAFIPFGRGATAAAAEAVEANRFNSHGAEPCA
ncbi:hypothetical protein BC567DRAFT_226516 [Phyllosticta citribraziliensis]